MTTRPDKELRLLYSIPPAAFAAAFLVSLRWL